ncbi:MAG: enoyl-CoA hydratase/isomerase family protein [Chloroflexi bacterium]|nr:enoyl-CoA hydratase/isomerase family protein [Chloroflexota bacterium]
MPTIHFERQGRVAVLTMQGDSDLNLGVVNEDLHQRLQEYRDDDELWCAVLVGAGQRAFTAGADLKAMAASGRMGGNFWSAKTLDLLTGIEFWKPLVAALNGYTLGQGLMLALACDIRIAAEHATLGLPEIKYGFPPGAGATQRLARVMPLGLALEMLLTGDRITAPQAYQWGLVNRVVPETDLLDAALEVAQRIASNPPLAVRATKELVMRSRDLPLGQGMRLETLLQQMCLATEDAREGPRAFAEKRPPEFHGR